MRRVKVLLVMACMGGVSAASPAGAQDASFGCKVLLCAAASNPGWSGIPYCVPVMNQLFSMMRRRNFSWPTCPEGNVGAPAYDPFEDCPAGSIAVATGENGVQPDPMGASCARPAAGQGRSAQPPGEWLQQEPELFARGRRSEPWYVNLDAGQGVRRFYFSLGQ